ncbi:hypothetical protein V8C86DRAFT_2531509 [Haematococcus lacustris]
MPQPTTQAQTHAWPGSPTSKGPLDCSHCHCRLICLQQARRVRLHRRSAAQQEGAPRPPPLPCQTGCEQSPPVPAPARTQSSRTPASLPLLAPPRRALGLQAWRCSPPSRNAQQQQLLHQALRRWPQAQPQGPQVQSPPGRADMRARRGQTRLGQAEHSPQSARQAPASRQLLQLGRSVGWGVTLGSPLLLLPKARQQVPVGLLQQTSVKTLSLDPCQTSHWGSH